MPFRGFNSPENAKHACGFMDNEYGPNLWERDLVHTTAPGTKWFWPKLLVEGGKKPISGVARALALPIWIFGAASIDGVDVDWPVSYDEIAPYYSRVEKIIGVASTQQNRPSNPDGEYLPRSNTAASTASWKQAAKKSASLFARPNRAAHARSQWISKMPLLRKLQQCAAKPDHFTHPLAHASASLSHRQC